MKAQIIILDTLTKDIKINSKEKLKYLQNNGVNKKFRIKSYKGDETIVELKNISVLYNKRQILDNLNLKINRQEILGMLGPNGLESQLFLI